MLKKFPGSPNSNPIIALPKGFTKPIIEKLLDYLYTGKVDVNEASLDLFFEVSRYFEVSGFDLNGSDIASGKENSEEKEDDDDEAPLCIDDDVQTKELDLSQTKSSISQPSLHFPITQTIHTNHTTIPSLLSTPQYQNTYPMQPKPGSAMIDHDQQKFLSSLLMNQTTAAGQYPYLPISMRSPQHASIAANPFAQTTLASVASTLAGSQRLSRSPEDSVDKCTSIDLSRHNVANHKIVTSIAESLGFPPYLVAESQERAQQKDSIKKLMENEKQHQLQQQQ